MNRRTPKALSAAPRTTEPRLAGVGAYRPERIVTNHEIAQHSDTSDAWIRERTGIAARRFAAAGETVADMAVAAAIQALAHAGTAAREVDLVLVATSTHPYQTPGVAPDLATRIGATGAGAADLAAGCAGFCYALGLAAAAIRAGSSRCAVVAASEKLSDFLDLTDRSTSCIFGDGAGAVVLLASDVATVGPVVWASDGRHLDVIAQWPAWLAYRHGDVPWPTLRMDGPAVFRWATTAVQPLALRACEVAGIPLSEVQAFIPHQANGRIIDALVRSLPLSSNVRVARNIAHMGNTSAASVPLALADLLATGQVTSGDSALCLAFGAGLSIAGQVMWVP